MRFIENKLKKCTNCIFFFFFDDHFHDFSQFFKIIMTFYKSDLFFRFFKFFITCMNPVFVTEIEEIFDLNN